MPLTKASQFTFIAISGEAELCACLDVPANKQCKYLSRIWQNAATRPGLILRRRSTPVISLNSLLSYGIVHFLFPSFKWKLCVCGCVMEAEIYVKKFVQNKTQI